MIEENVQKGPGMSKILHLGSQQEWATRCIFKSPHFCCILYQQCKRDSLFNFPTLQTQHPL